MRALLIGSMNYMEYLYQWLQRSGEIFEINTIFSENDTSSELFTCNIGPIDELSVHIFDYDVIFLCSLQNEKYRNILLLSGVDEKRIKTMGQVCEYLSPKDCMEYYRQKMKCLIQLKTGDAGDFSYGSPDVRDFGEGRKLTIGKFCSIADGVIIFLGGNHRADWCTTYPFNALMDEFSYIKGHPSSNGDVVIGNDVWIGSGAKIMSGVTVGDGSIIAACACVTKDVSPYTIVGGVPAKKIRSRFSRDITERLLEMRWWDWNDELIYDAIPLLQSSSFEELFAFYEQHVRPSL